ncbi:PREDICTED: X-linked retinitis pigmentosa GTPase regulator [Ceratosolen solmsi marchali]|uniref:X-linked retinitis pigmentosa GTPase regulator n=1 Tax=Ceratosolen solmsi marchali TaxID=326594 RepID=A0AAJ6YF42_9HYME|nr:PREDICTED: X-linked retinitis pigmentosa GTPase regulator [Ceratosolen solmsi marchali]
MPKIYFSGLNASKLIHENNFHNPGTVLAIDKFISLSYDDITDIEIGWDYILIWKNNDLYISGKIVTNESNKLNRLLKIPEHTNLKFKQAIAGSENVTILTNDNCIWMYNIYNETWKKVKIFISSVSEVEKEYVIKIAQGRCTVALTNLGRILNIPISVNNPEVVKFIDVACGYDHVILLTEKGDVYTTGMGTRGQLGHGDLEDCDKPKLVEAITGLKIVQISAGGWHNAVISNQGDLYTWGWNNQGQLGQPNIENIVAVPTIVDFANEIEEKDYNVTKVECGSTFTICITDTGELWGSGSNKYGQLGLLRKNIFVSKLFIPLNINYCNLPIKDFKCREWSCCIFTG